MNGIWIFYVCKTHGLVMCVIPGNEYKNTCNTCVRRPVRQIQNDHANRDNLCPMAWLEPRDIGEMKVETAECAGGWDENSGLDLTKQIAMGDMAWTIYEKRRRLRFFYAVQSAESTQAPVAADPV